ncbi:MAG TPA: hypothetical protein VGF45_18190 [Polyangia bacterium]
MNRRRSQPARPNNSEASPAQTSAAFDEELAQAFFQAGHSEELLAAVSERQSESELSAKRARGSARFIYGAAALGIGAAALLSFVPRHFADGPAPVMAVAPVPPTPPAASPPPAEPEPPPSEPGPTATAAVAAGMIVDDNDSAGTPESVPAEPAAAVATTLVTATAQAPVSVQDLRARPASAETAQATLPPGDLLAEAAPPSPADAAKEACTKLLRRGRYSDIRVSCGRAFTAEPSAALAVQVARHALEHERYTDAQTWSRKAIELDEGHSEAFVTLGGAEHGLGHRTLARNAYARYLELEPQGPYADDVRALIDSL